MASRTGASRTGLDRQSKYVFFAAIAVCTLLVIWVDERFLIRPRDPEWAHIAPFSHLLLVHGLFGATALLTGTAQFSTRLRRMPGVHRWTGRVYLGAVTVGGLFGGFIDRHFEGPGMLVQQTFQAGAWATCAWVGWWFMRRRNLRQHRLWMMRSYGFCLVFVFSRVPDGIPGFHFTPQLLVDTLWVLCIGALLLPELALPAERRGSSA